MWDFVESELARAEAECNKIELSDELLENALLAQFIRDPPPPPSDKLVGKDEKESDKTRENSSGTGKDKTSDGTGVDKPEKRKYRRRSMSCGSLEEAIQDNAKKSGGGTSKTGSTSAVELTLPLFIVDKNVIPLRSTTIPRTPRGVPLFVSQLSSYPDKVAGAGYGGFLGSRPEDMRYLLPLDKIYGHDDTAYGLPGSFNSKKIELDEIAALEIEISHLEASIREERLLNEKLQSEAVGRKRKWDEICTAMTLLRSETESVLLRHNVILDTEEARMKSWEVVKEGKREEVAAEQAGTRDEDEEETEDSGEGRQVESSEAGMEESRAQDEDDLEEESEPETAMDEDLRGNADADDEVEEEDDEEEEDEEEEDEGEVDRDVRNVGMCDIVEKILLFSVMFSHRSSCPRPFAQITPIMKRKTN